MPRILGAAFGMGVALWALDQACAPLFAGRFLERTLALAAVITLGAAVYGVLALLFGAARWRELKARLVRRAS